MSGAPEGNKNGERFKTAEERTALFEAWYKHRSEGYSQDSFPMCDYDTLQRYAKEYPIEFPPIKMEEAERNCYLFWEAAGRKMMWMGAKDVSPVVWIFNMKNRFKWRDNVDITSDGKKLETLNGLLGSLATTKSSEDQGTTE